MKNVKKLVGERIREVRLKAGFTQKHLAEKMGIDQARISDWERGKHLPEGVLKAELLRILRSEESLIDIPSSSENQEPSRYHPTPEEMSRVYHALADGMPERRLLGLYLLIGDEEYYEQALRFPDAVPIARVLKKYPL